MAALHLISFLALVSSTAAITCSCTKNYEDFLERVLAKLEKRVAQADSIVSYFAKNPLKPGILKTAYNELKPEVEMTRSVQDQIYLAKSLQNSCRLNRCKYVGPSKEVECFVFEEGFAKMIGTNGVFQAFEDFKILSEEFIGKVSGCASHSMLYYGAGVGPNVASDPKESTNCKVYYKPWANGGWRSKKEVFACYGDGPCTESFQFRRFYTCPKSLCNKYSVEGFCLPFMREILGY